MTNPCDRITEAELQILKVLWANEGPMTGSAIIAAVSAGTAWNPSTIKTLIRRLQSKEAIAVEQREVMHYTARIGEAEFGEYQTARLIETFYSGKAGNLISALYDAKQIGLDDLEELRKRLNEGKRHE
jgi:BlaI family penicillinase repressor